MAWNQAETRCACDAILSLTDAELYTAAEVVRRRSADDAAAALGLSRHTVKNHLTQIYEKLMVAGAMGAREWHILSLADILFRLWLVDMDVSFWRGVVSVKGECPSPLKTPHKYPASVPNMKIHTSGQNEGARR